MSKLTINNVELELNMLDADVVEKYENLMTKVKEDISNPANYEGLSNADSMRYQVKVVDTFFDDLFGTGTASKVFPHNNDLGLRLEAFGQVSEVSNDASDQVSAIVNKYNPQRVQNREQRRATNHGKKKNKNFHAVTNS